MASLEAGFSHDIFVEWATDTRNLILFTERGQVCFFTCLQIRCFSVLFLCILFMALCAGMCD